MKKKILVACLCVALAVLTIAGTTLAYLTSKDTVTNTFTVGNVKITLDEAKVNTAGEPLNEKGEKVNTVADAARVANNDYKLMPGKTYVKDPTVTVKAVSEESYIRMLVHVNDMTKLTGAFPKAKYADYYGTGDVFLLEKLVDWNSTDWNCVGYTADTGDNAKGGTYEFRYKTTVSADKDDVKLPALFNTITVPDTVDNDALAKLSNVEIEITAEAIQADGFKDAAEAWEKFGN